MNTVISRDGTAIAYDRSGQGPVVILVGGALQYRALDQGMAQLANLLSPYFTVIHYDRRGRVDSMDTLPYIVAREVDDIEALVDAAGGKASLYGISSGGALAMEAAIALGSKIQKLAIYGIPYNNDPAARQSWREYTNKLGDLLAEGRRGDAAGLFMMLVGLPPDQLEGMRYHPMWPLWETIGHTLAYDQTGLLGEDASIPFERAAKVTVPTLVIDGGASFPFMNATANTLAEAMSHGQGRTLEGQTHEVSAEALAPVLIEFFQSSPASGK